MQRKENPRGRGPSASWWRAALHRLSPPANICRHREWTKFGTYSEAMLRRLIDDLC